MEGMNIECIFSHLAALSMEGMNIEFIFSHLAALSMEGMNIECIFSQSTSNITLIKMYFVWGLSFSQCKGSQKLEQGGKRACNFLWSMYKLWTAYC